MRSTPLCLAGMLLSLSAVAADQPAGPKSVCDIAGTLMVGCAVPRPSVDQNGEVWLDFSIEGPQRTVVASLADTTSKTGVLVTAERVQRSRAYRVDEPSEWCKRKKE